MNFIGVQERMQLPLQAIHLLGQCAIPIALLLIERFHDIARKESIITRIQIPVTASVLRLAIIPAFMLLLAWALPFSAELKQVLMVQRPCLAVSSPLYSLAISTVPPKSRSKSYLGPPYSALSPCRYGLHWAAQSPDIRALQIISAH